MENELRIIISERGEELVVHNSNKYRFIRLQRQDKMIKMEVFKQIKYVQGAYCHILINIQQSIFLVSTIILVFIHQLRKLYTKNRRIIMYDKTKQNNAYGSYDTSTSTFVYKDVHLVRNAMYYEKRKYYPKFSQSLNETIAHIRVILCIALVVPLSSSSSVLQGYRPIRSVAMMLFPVCCPPPLAGLLLVYWWCGWCQLTLCPRLQRSVRKPSLALRPRDFIYTTPLVLVNRCDDSDLLDNNILFFSYVF